MKQPKLTLKQQWLKLLELPTAPNRLTKDLYEAMYTRGSFIAHFDRAGFYRARFSTLGAFDQTIDMMLEVPELKALYLSSEPDLVGNARYKIASMEANLLKTQALIMQDHVSRLQSKFTKALV